MGADTYKEENRMIFVEKAELRKRKGLSEADLIFVQVESLKGRT